MGQRLTGETVILIVKTQTGTDPYRRPIYEESEVEVQNVLVGSPESQDVTAELEMSGKRIAYVLGIPKGDTNICDWSQFDRNRSVHTSFYDLLR